jgi:glycosyltransferase involved in cell wall biosynthesis
MKLSIITPTYKRPEKLRRAITSVVTQTHSDWEMIVVNDNPGDNTHDIVKGFADSRITYVEQPANAGVNGTRNLGMDHVSADSEWVVLLDDDDYLAPNALSVMTELLSETNCNWLVTSRAIPDGKILTSSKKNRHQYNYFRDYLLLRRLGGDATHCFRSSFVNGKVAHIRFPSITQGEEWLFFATLGKYSKIYYINTSTTLTDGYDANGLNFRRRTTREQLQLIPTFIREGYLRGLLLYPLFWLYITLRILRAFLK